MTTYSDDFKASIVAKLLAPLSLSVPQLVKETGIPRDTLYGWRRKYTHQVLLTEEFSRHGVETVFIKAPQSATPEDQLLVQFQGMIAEYERAQILERSRRGKRHGAKAGEVANSIARCPDV